MLLAQAKNIAEKVVEQLAPHCTICHIAGSIRRGKPVPKDIEVVALPREWATTTGGDLFGDTAPAVYHRSEAFAGIARGLGTVVTGDPKKGRYAKIALPEGIQLDLFMPQPADFWRQFAIRTGSGGPDGFSAKVIATAWVRKGWRGTEEGLRRHDECHAKSSKWECTALNPTLPPVWESEQEFFEWLGVGWVPPKMRSFESDWLQFLKMKTSQHEHSDRI